MQSKRAAQSQLEQAVKTAKWNKIVLPAVKVNDNVTDLIPAGDRGRTDLRNIIDVVTDISYNEIYFITNNGD